MERIIVEIVIEKSESCGKGSQLLHSRDVPEFM